MVGTVSASSLFAAIQSKSSVFTAKPAPAKDAAPAAPAPAPAEDAVAFSKAALAALKAGSPSAAATAPDAATAAAPSARATAGPAPLLKIEGGLAPVDFKEIQRMMDIRMGHMEEERTFHRATQTALRGAFGLPADIEQGGGLMISGAIIDPIRKWMEANGTRRPEKPAELAAWDKAHAGGEAEPPPPPGTARTAMITLFLPGSQGTGSEQVEIWIDNQAFEKLASLSADEVKAGLIDLMKGGSKADSVNKAIADGPFGRFMTENAAYHPEFSRPNARLAFTDPEGGDHPLLMIQSESRPDYVMEHADELVDTVMGILKAAYPQAGA